MSTPPYQQLELGLLLSCSSSSPMVQDSWQHSSFYVFIPVSKKEEDTKNASLPVRMFSRISYNLVLFSELLTHFQVGFILDNLLPSYEMVAVLIRKKTIKMWGISSRLPQGLHFSSFQVLVLILIS